MDSTGAEATGAATIGAAATGAVVGVTIIMDLGGTSSLSVTSGSHGGGAGVDRGGVTHTATAMATRTVMATAATDTIMASLGMDMASLDMDMASPVMEPMAANPEWPSYSVAWPAQVITVEPSMASWGRRRAGQSALMSGTTEM